MTTTDRPTRVDDAARPNPAAALLLGREIAGLKALMVVRGIVIVTLFISISARASP
jgi:hypothetical protein